MTDEIKKKPGRPYSVVITEEQRRSVVAGAALGLSDTDIAIIVGINRRTLERRCAAELERGRAEMRHRLHRIQWEMAAKNPTMAIWLGKQYLGQRDVPLPMGQQGAVIEFVQRVVATEKRSGTSMTDRENESTSRNIATPTPAAVRQQ